MKTVRCALALIIALSLLCSAAAPAEEISADAQTFGESLTEALSSALSVWSAAMARMEEEAAESEKPYTLNLALSGGQNNQTAFEADVDLRYENRQKYQALISSPTLDLELLLTQAKTLIGGGALDGKWFEVLFEESAAWALQTDFTQIVKDAGREVTAALAADADLIGEFCDRVIEIVKKNHAVRVFYRKSVSRKNGNLYIEADFQEISNAMMSLLKDLAEDQKLRELMSESEMLAYLQVDASELFASAEKAFLSLNESLYYSNETVRLEAAFYKNGGFEIILDEGKTQYRYESLIISGNMNETQEGTLYEGSVSLVENRLINGGATVFDYSASLLVSGEGFRAVLDKSGSEDYFGPGNAEGHAELKGVFTRGNEYRLLELEAFSYVGDSIYGGEVEFYGTLDLMIEPDIVTAGYSYSDNAYDTYRGILSFSRDPASEERTADGVKAQRAYTLSFTQWNNGMMVFDGDAVLDMYYNQNAERLNTGALLTLSWLYPGSYGLESITGDSLILGADFTAADRNMTLHTWAGENGEIFDGRFLLAVREAENGTDYSLDIRMAENGETVSSIVLALSVREKEFTLTAKDRHGADKIGIELKGKGETTGNSYLYTLTLTGTERGREIGVYTLSCEGESEVNADGMRGENTLKLSYEESNRAEDYWLNVKWSLEEGAIMEQVPETSGTVLYSDLMQVNDYNSFLALFGKDGV